MGNHTSDRMAAETLRRRVALLDRLVVTHEDQSGTPVLKVDASALAEEPSAWGAHVYRLRPVDGRPGLWRCVEAADEGTLGHLLRAIAGGYDTPEAPA